MARKSRKKHKGPQQRQIVSRIDQLGMRLDELFKPEIILARDAPAVQSAIDAAIAKIRLTKALPAVVAAYLRADLPVQQRLDSIFPQWLKTEGYVDLLLSYLQGFNLSPELRRVVLGWLEKCEVDPALLKKLEMVSPFFRAFTHTNEFQGILTVLWYLNRQKNHVKGMSFLLDFHPPWEGSVKDFMLLPTREPQEAIREFIHGYEQRIDKMEELSEKEAKRAILRYLGNNRRENIRLPANLISAREVFLNLILSPADAPDTPAFTPKDFDDLSKLEKKPESLKHIEEVQGGLMRLADGSIVRISKPRFDDDIFYSL